MVDETKDENKGKLTANKPLQNAVQDKNNVPNLQMTPRYRSLSPSFSDLVSSVTELKQLRLIRLKPRHPTGIPEEVKKNILTEEEVRNILTQDRQALDNVEKNLYDRLKKISPKEFEEVLEKVLIAAKVKEAAPTAKLEPTTPKPQNQ